MKVAVGQCIVKEDWKENLSNCLSILKKAAHNGASLLVLPEAMLIRNEKPEDVLTHAQDLSGPFLKQLLSESIKYDVTVILTLHTPSGKVDKVFNTCIALHQGKIISSYNKIHLYDAFNTQESQYIEAGSQIPELFEINGFKVGIMTCYDIRFPELARKLVDKGADIIALPAAWVKGSLKEFHWKTLVTARALENTCYLLAAGECGTRNIGLSMVVDPLGVAIAQAAEQPAIIYAEVEKERINYARRVLPVLQNRRLSVSDELLP